MGIFRNLLIGLKLSKLASMPDWERAHLASRAFAVDGDWERAAMWGRIAAQENRGSAEVWNDLGFALNGLGQAQWDTAPPETLMPQASLPEQPLVELGDAGIRRSLARAEAIGTWEEAADALARALAINPRFAQALNNYGVAMLKCDRLAEGRDAFVSALQLNPDYSNAKGNLAFAESQIAKLPDLS